MKRCVWCDGEFSPVRGQTYCSAECKSEANVELTRIRQENARRARRKSSEKKCIVCGAQLSMYGHGNTCASHINPNPFKVILKQIKDKS